MRTNHLFKILIAMLFITVSSTAQVSLFYQNGKAGYKNTVTGEVVVTAHYTAASNMIQLPSGDYYALVFEGTKAGYINDKGEVIIPLIYDDASVFSDGMARVKMGGKYGFINLQGKTVIPFDYNLAGDFVNGMARVEQGGKWGFIDIKGRTAIAIEYYNAGDFSEGVAPVMTETGSWGFINAQGTFVIKPAYIKAESFKNGEALVHNGEKFIFIDLSGKVLRDLSR